MSVVSSITKYPVMMSTNGVEQNSNKEEEAVLKEFNQCPMQDVIESSILAPLQLDEKEQRDFEKSIADNNSDSQHVDSEVKKVKYAVQQRYSDMELLEKTEEDEEISEAQMKLMKTLPPKYSDESDIRNNIICANNNIYIYAENKNGNLNEEACITVSDDNKVIYCSTRGRRYTIGGYANIEKKLNNEYHFFEDANPFSTQTSKNTFEFETFQDSELPTNISCLNISGGNNRSEETMRQMSNRTDIFMDVLSNNTFESNLSSTKSLSGHFSVQQLFKDYKKLSQTLEHEHRTCKPCAHVYNGSTCMNGDDCAFCHHPDHVLISAKKWKKLVKNNMEKLDAVLHILRNPNDPKNIMLKEMIMPSQKNMSGKKMSIRNQNGMKLNNMNYSMNTATVTPMNHYKKNRNNKKYIQQKNMETIVGLPYQYYESNESIPMVRGRNNYYNQNNNYNNNMNNNHMGYVKGYNGKLTNMQTHNLNVHM